MSAVDPVVRLSLFMEAVRRERKLVAAILAAAIIALGAVVSSTAPPKEPFSRAELENLSDLPLAPDDAPEQAPSEAEEAALREIERKMRESREQPQQSP